MAAWALVMVSGGVVLGQGSGVSGGPGGPEQSPKPLARGVEPDAATARARLVETTRQLYLATPTGQRGAVLAAMLVDPLEPIRVLGFDLAMREVAEGRDPGRAVADAAGMLLDGDSVRGRARGAALLGRLGPADAPGRIVAALDRETAEVAAAAMLRAMARWPGAEVLPAVERWLSADGEAQAAAAAAGLAVVELGVVPGGAVPGGGQAGWSEAIDARRRGELLTVLRAWPPSAQSVEAVVLLARLGDEADREAIRAMLGAADAELRSRAARALVGDAGSRGAILDAAAVDARLFGFAVEALGAGAVPGVAEFAQLARCPVGTGQQGAGERMAGLMRVAGRLDGAELLRAARAVRDEPVLAESLLVLLVNGQVPGGTSGAETGAAVLGEAAVELAELRLADRRHELALAALARVPEEGVPTAVRTRAARIRVVAELAIGRVASAAELAGVAPASAWLDGLDRALLSPHAPAIIATVRASVADRFTPADRRRFEFLCSKAALAGVPAESARPALPVRALGPTGP